MIKLGFQIIAVQILVKTITQLNRLNSPSLTIYVLGPYPNGRNQMVVQS